jgi:hypothetical protein
VIIDMNLAAVLISLFTLCNTALLVYQTVHLHSVPANVDGRAAAAIKEAHAAGLSEGKNP